MNQKHKPYYYIDTYIDVSSYLPQTVDTDFELIFYLNYDNSLKYLSEANTEYINFYRVPNKTATITDVSVSTNPAMNRYEYSSDIFFTHIQVVLTDTFYPYNQPPPLANMGGVDTCFQGPGNYRPGQLAIDSTGTYGYMGQNGWENDGFDWYNINNFTPGGYIYLGPNTNRRSGIVLTPDNNFIFASTGGDASYSVVKIDANTRSAVQYIDASLSYSYRSDRLAITNQYVYGFNPWTGRFIRYDFNFGNFTSTYVEITASYALQITPDSQFLIAGMYNGNVHKVSTSSLTVLNTLKVGGLVEAIEISPDGNFCYCSVRENNLATSGQIVKLNLTTFLVEDTYPLSVFSRAIVHHPTENYLFVGTWQKPAKIITLNTVPTMKMIYSITLKENQLQNYLEQAIRDPIRPYMYFGAQVNAGETGCNLLRYDYSQSASEVLISGPSNNFPTNLENNVTLADLDFKSQINKRIDNLIPSNNCFIALYVKGYTGGQLNDQPQSIHVRLKVYPYA